MEEAKSYFINLEEIRRIKISPLFGWISFLEEHKRA